MTIIFVFFNLDLEEKYKSFINRVKEILENYEEIILINKNKLNDIELIKQKLNDDSIVVIFNEDIIDNISYIEDFLKLVVERKIKIFPVAIDRENRIPPVKIINEIQSYDVYEQMRCRNLEGNYLAIAEIFARKIISEIHPLIYDKEGIIFISHRRIDGEDIAARLSDKLKLQGSIEFRDNNKIVVGENAQKKIDEVLTKCDVFIFMHTPEATTSEWVKKELKYAIFHNIPILWIRIDKASIKDLEIIPTEKPHLEYKSIDFKNDDNLNNIVNEIKENIFKLKYNKISNIYDYDKALKRLMDDNLVLLDKNQGIYKVEATRKGYYYPQRNIKEYIQLFERNIKEEDINNKGEYRDYDSFIMLNDRIDKKEIINKEKNIVKDNIKNFYYNWKDYLKGNLKMKNKEIVISGAFPDGSEFAKRVLTEALIIFAKAILKNGYTLTFGAHPTFQELFFEIYKEEYKINNKSILKMYISKFFEKEYSKKRDELRSKVQLCEVEQKGNLLESLSFMREQMIGRKEVGALICLGGKIKNNKKEEGIREEIEIARKYNIPVFIVGSVGGCSSVVAREYKESWYSLNNASENLNEEFRTSIDYFTLAEELVKFLEE